MTHSITAEKRTEFERLFQEFVQSYLHAPEGQYYIVNSAKARHEAYKNYQTVLAKLQKGEDCTDTVLLTWLPYTDSASNRARGAWIHVSPAIAGDIRTWYQASGWTHPDDWPAIAVAIVHFVQQCMENPEHLGAVCQEFSALAYAKGFQTSTLTPILNALHPAEFLLISNKSRRALNYFSCTTFSPALTDYPVANDALRGLLLELSNILQRVQNANPQISQMPSADLFNMFCHWLVTVKKFAFRETRYWKIAIGHEAWQWEEWHEGNFVAIGWDELGDISGLNKRDFEQIRNSLIAQYSGWTKSGTNQVWRFARQIREGDRIVVTRGTDLVLGVAVVTGAYFYVADMPSGHRYPVEWEDITPRQIDEPSWRKTFHELDKASFDLVLQAPVSEQKPQEESDVDGSGQPEMPPYLRYVAPIVDILQELGGTASAEEITRHLRERTDSGTDEHQQLLPTGVSSIKNLVYRARVRLVQAGLLESFKDGTWRLTQTGLDDKLTADEIQKAVQEADYQRKVTASLQQESPAIRRLAETTAVYDVQSFRQDSTSGTPPAQVAEAQAAPNTPQPIYTLAECAEALYLDEAVLERWVRTLERKKQMIFTGPSGTGKTYTAEWLAKYLVGGGDGFVELLQFHPAYAYEDFIQGIRPRSVGGRLDYPVVPGRFLEFCQRATQCTGRCVLIIDEINRADLARVFGELMYLLEYRDQAIRLAGDNRWFQIPANVYLLGTMNTADRSIALVDHALRRRFSFVTLGPNYEVLRRFHQRQQSDFPVEPLILLLQRINQRIGDPHYALGISFFLRSNLTVEIQDIWEMEIEPYLEEYFFDQPDRVEEFRWDKVGETPTS